MTRSARRIVGIVGILVVVVVGSTSSTAAHIDPTHPVGASAPFSITLSGLGDGQGTTGFIAPASFDPLGGYPAAPPAGSTASDESFAGTIQATSNTTPPITLLAYCIDLRTATWVGLSYDLGTWSASAVPNVSRVARLLNDYFPNTGEPAAATSDIERGAAVQAAIWFFTDRYILDTNDPLHDLTAAIVTDVLAKPPLPEPSLPLTLGGPASGVADSAIGPFTISTTAANVVVHVAGGQLFSDAAATMPIADGATIPASTQLFLVAGGPGTATITVDAAITAPSGRVLLYEPANAANPNPAIAQKLILAGDALVTASATASIDIAAAPSAPPSAEPSSPPSAPPSAPPSGAPSTPPSGAPSTPPTVAPSEPPSSPPSTPPSAAPSTPPSVSPSEAPPASSSPTGEVLPATGTPGQTPPATSTEPTAGGGSSTWQLLIVGLAAIATALIVDARRRRSPRV